ncbi:MAG TPA: DCC1-like thiol-disulfide oxidoreductase family protein [Solirubrobacteraceae bacterium]
MSDRLLLLYDRDCGLCRCVVAAVLTLDRAGRLQPVALQSADAERLLPGLSPEERLASFHIVEEASGHVSSAGAGLAELVSVLQGGRSAGRALKRAPGASEPAYKLVAEHRHAIGRWIPGPVKEAARRRVDQAERTGGKPRSS